MTPKTLKNKAYDLIIIGGGPAGLAASIYASRYLLKHLIITDLMGGTISGTHLIDNYPGIEEISGFEFSQKLIKHAKKYKTNIILQRVNRIKKIKDFFELALINGEKIITENILIAVGNKKRRLGVPGEESFLGKGVSYCATCDGFFYKNKTVAVIGGNDSALGAALYLAELTNKVYLIYRKSNFRAEPYWIKGVENNKKIKTVFNANVIEFLGKTKLESIKLDKKYKQTNKIILEGVFIEIGAEPEIKFAESLKIKTNKNGFIEVKSDGSTSVPGVWAAGDITDGSDGFCQVITAAAEGAIAARSIYKSLKNESA